MSPRGHKHDDLLRRALHAAVESVEPADDALERILARVTVPYPMPVAWIVLGLSKLAWRTRAGLQHVWAWLRTSRGPAVQPFRPALPRRLRHAAVLVMAGLVVAAGALMLSPLRGPAIAHAVALIQSVRRGSSAAGNDGSGASDHDMRPSPGVTGATAAGYAAQGHLQTAAASCTPPSSDPASPATTAIAGPSTTAAPVPGLSPSVNLTSAAPTACPSPTASVTPTVTTPNPTPSTTPTVTPSTTPTPSITPSVTPSTGATPSASP
jgi:hypothetical protein